MMGDMEREALEAALVRHYETRRAEVGIGDIDRLVRTMLAEGQRADRMERQRAGLVAFVWNQVRYVPAWTWMAQAALVALMCTIAFSSGDHTAMKMAIGILSAMTVLVGAPTVHSSKQNGMAELEYSCPNNAASVMVARLVVLGCSSSLAVAVMIGATSLSLETSAFCVVLWSAPPFFLSCAGSLMALRKADPAVTTTICVSWTAICSASLIALANVLPEMYAQASLAVWAAAAASACAWLVHEVAMTIRTVSAGFDAFSPHMARTHN